MAFWHNNNPNREHPAWRLQELLTQLGRYYQAQSNRTLDIVIRQKLDKLTAEDAAKVAWPEKRKEKIKLLLDYEEVAYKDLWFKRYGWKFEDTLDEAKFKQHLEAMKVSEEAVMKLKKEPLRVEVPA